jgi:error-prone DNA polymerase
VVYPNDAIREVLHKTLGVPLFQEQAMRLAVVAAGFTPGEADQLRRVMGAWRRKGIIAVFQQRLIEGMLANGLSAEFADQVFHQISGFGEYGFPESHAASFALLAYASAWLKCHYPAEFTTAMLNSQPLGFYAPAQLVRDVREHGVEVRPVDVNFSRWDCTLEAVEPAANANAPVIATRLAVRLGLRMVRGFSAALATMIETARRDEAFSSVDDFARRTGFAQAALSRLADADAFGSLGLDRRAALWRALSQEKRAATRPLLEGLEAEDPPATLPPLSAQEQVWADYQTSGLSLKAHPISFCRETLEELKIVPSARLAELPNHRSVSVAGLVLMRQRPSTARGITFVTLEDETGTANLVVHPGIWERYYQAARTAAALVAHGWLQREKEVIHVVVSKLEDLGNRLRELKAHSRDFY